MVELKVMGGLLKGVSLSFPKERMRPTSSLLKRRFFDSFQNFSTDFFIDLCAGSGSIGIEAWSRGSKELILCEKSLEHMQVIKNNVDLVKKRFAREFITRPIQIIHSDCLDFAKKIDINSIQNRLNENGSLFIFFDPPYENHQLYIEVIHKIKALFPSTTHSIFFIIESCAKKGVPLDQLKSEFVKDPLKVFKQGTKYMAIFGL